MSLCGSLHKKGQLTISFNYINFFHFMQLQHLATLSTNVTYVPVKVYPSPSLVVSLEMSGQHFYRQGNKCMFPASRLSSLVDN